MTKTNLVIPLHMKGYKRGKGRKGHKRAEKVIKGRRVFKKLFVPRHCEA